MTHYYNATGLPAYTIIGKNGKSRTPYVKEAKELGLVPGVTTITGQLANGGLTQWFINNAIETARTTEFDAMGESPETWTKKVKDKLKAENERVTGQGHDIHDALEKYYKTGKISAAHKDFITPVIDLMAETWPNLQRTDWIAERSFNYCGLYGGKVDISTEAEGGIILDFKTKDSDDIKKYVAYEGHKQQLVAYAYGLNMFNASLGNIFLSALTPNIVKLDMHGDLDIHWEKFKFLIQYWHIENYNNYIRFDNIFDRRDL